MASLGQSNYILAVVMVAAAANICMVLTVSGAKLPRAAGAAACITDGAVFPYWSTCFSPAVYYGQEVYTIAAASGSLSGSLAPEYDESNSTYYMRLSDTGAQYKLMHSSFEYRLYVKQSDDVMLVNVESGRALGWRQEGEDEFWLVETDDSSAALQFAADGDVLLPCPLIYPPAQCVAYNIVTYSNSSIGLSSIEEDGVTYFKQGSNKGVPFLLVRGTTVLKATKSHVLAAPA